VGHSRYSIGPVIFVEGEEPMYNGLSYKHAFENACQSLANESDTIEVRSTLIGVEWVLSDGICGVFFLSAMLQTAAAMMSVGWLLNINLLDFEVCILV
jgi:hypothetical protein